MLLRAKKTSPGTKRCFEPGIIIGGVRGGNTCWGLIFVHKESEFCPCHSWLQSPRLQRGSSDQVHIKKFNFKGGQARAKNMPYIRGLLRNAAWGDKTGGEWKGTANQKANSNPDCPKMKSADRA